MGVLKKPTDIMRSGIPPETNWSCFEAKHIYLGLLVFFFLQPMVWSSTEAAKQISICPVTVMCVPWRHHSEWFFLPPPSCRPHMHLHPFVSLLLFAWQCFPLSATQSKSPQRPQTEFTWKDGQGVWLLSSYWWVYASKMCRIHGPAQGGFSQIFPDPSKE